MTAPPDAVLYGSCAPEDGNPNDAAEDSEYQRQGKLTQYLEDYYNSQNAAEWASSP